MKLRIQFQAFSFQISIRTLSKAEKTSSGTFELTAKGLIQLETAEDKEKRKQNEGNC